VILICNAFVSLASLVVNLILLTAADRVMYSHSPAEFESASPVKPMAPASQ
jgi:hypothetical protein